MKIRSYDIQLDVDFKAATIDGTVTINLTGAPNRFALDAVSMHIGRVRVNGLDLPFNHDQEKGKLAFKMTQRDTEIVVEYHKVISEDVIYGVYKSCYGSDYILATDFEPAEARTLMPCIDNPSFKAVFRLSVTTDKNLLVISNMPVKLKQDTPDERKRFIFQPTPPMSTYLFFVGVGKFEETKKSSGSTEIIFASRPNQSSNSLFALDVAAHVLKYFSDYFSVPFPLPKLHLVALPEYHTGAMENWGAITSREAFMLLGDDSSVTERRDAGLVIAHEIAHQWFGDLVTMQWWNDIWLNESFATFMQAKCMEELYPSDEYLQQFIRQQTFPAMHLDSLSSTHPVQVAVRTPKEANQVFDLVSYGKGASLLRMIEAYIGQGSFRKGVQKYLHRFGYSNATSSDLWHALGTASDKPLDTLMKKWLTKPGFPLLKVNFERRKLKLSQSRFLLSGARDDKWPIPVTLQLNGELRSFLMRKKRHEIEASNITSLKVNTNQTGFYRVLYGPSLNEVIANEFPSLSAYDKWGVLSDLFAFLVSGDASPNEYYRFVRLSSEESDLLVVNGVIDQLQFLTTIAEKAQPLRRYASEFYKSQLVRLGLEAKSESESEKAIRGAIALALVRIDDDFAGNLAERFSDYGKIDPNMKAAVATAYVRTNGETVFEPLVSLLKNSDKEIDRDKIYTALTSFKEPKLVERTLELAISGEVSRSDSAYALPYSALNPTAREAVWDWIKRKYDRMWELYAGSGQIFSIYQYVVPRCGIGREQDVRKFFSGDRMKQGKMVFKTIYELLSINSKLRKRLGN